MKDNKNQDNVAKEAVLIIEDDMELRFLIVGQLSDTYTVYQSDGFDALDVAFKHIPDIVITDFNLPDKQGNEICSILKEDVKTSHIPVVVLTANDTETHHLQSLESGADMFLTKPVKTKILKKSLETLLNNRKKSQKHYKAVSFAKDENQESTSVTKNEGLNTEFIKRMNKLILKNIDNSDFTVELLAEQMLVSRVQLYRKVKALLNVSVSDYVLNIRLEKAKDLLLSTKEVSINEVAYSLGFSSPNYFSTTFKKKFGKSPKYYRK